MKAPRAKRRPAAPTPPPPPPDPATDYARAVVAGEVVAGPMVRDACARHLRDLAEGPARGLHWDVAEADYTYGFFRDVLMLNGGEHENMPFVLLDWQKFIVGSLFGWKLPDGTRRFRMAFVLTAKGSGKSPLAAGIGIKCFVADDEPRAEVYAAATTADQAAILFRDAVAMVEMSPPLSSRITKSGRGDNTWNLAHLASRSFFRRISSDKRKSGPRPHCVLLDEIHEHRDSSIVDMLRAGTKGRRQALIFGITNAASSRISVCAVYREYAAKVCSGALQDDSFFAYVCGLDEDDDPFQSEECWPKANPSLGQTIQMKYLRDLVTQARGMPSKEAEVRRLNFCQETDATNPWIDRDLWDGCQVKFNPDDLTDWPCWGGLDLSSKRDLTSLALCWRDPSDGGLWVATWFWTPGDTLESRAQTDNVPYPLWRDQQHLFAPPGKIIDMDHVAKFVQQLAAKHKLDTLAFDQALIEDFVKACDRIGFEVWIDDRKPDDDGVPIGQPGYGLRLQRHGQGYAGYQSVTTLWMTRSINDLEGAIVKGTVRILENPVLRYCSASAQITPDASGNRKWDKKKSTGRIDGMLSMTMAVGAAEARRPLAKKSFWE